MRTKSTWVILVSFIVFSNILLGQITSIELESKIDSIMGYSENHVGPGSAVSVVKNEETLISKGYGYASLEHSSKINSLTNFDIASLSKQFTGFAIAMLIEDGLIDLKDDVRKYIPELKNFGSTITIEHLIHHTSGLRDWTGTLTMAGWNYDDLITYDQIIRMTFNQEALNFAPGTEFQYSNTGYNLLVEILQRVTKTSFREWTTSNIFKPLRMKNSFFLDDLSEVVPNKANSYHKNENGIYHVDYNNTIALGSSSLNTTIEDLSKWVINLQNKRIGGEKVIQRIYQTTTLNDGKIIDYAYGFWVGTYRGTKWVDHTGGWESFRTYLTHFPDKNLSIVILNNNEESPFRKALAIANLFIPEVANTTNEITEDNSNKKKIEFPIGNESDLAGIYKFGPAWYLSIKYVGDTLYGQETGEDMYPILIEATGKYSMNGLHSFAFERSSDNVQYNIIFNGELRKRVDENTMNLPSCEEYLGEYFSKELQTEYQVIFDETENCISLQHLRRGKIILQRAWKDDFLAEEWLTLSINFVRDDSNKVVGFSATESGARNQLFLKR